MRLSISGLAFLMLGGCATIDHGGSDEVPVVSDPPGALVSPSAGTTSNGPNCRSPCTVYVDRRDDVTVTLSKAGFGTQAVEVKAQWTGAQSKDVPKPLDENKGAVLIDNLTGASFIHVPNAVVVKLAPVG